METHKISSIMTIIVITYICNMTKTSTLLNIMMVSALYRASKLNRGSIMHHRYNQDSLRISIASILKNTVLILMMRPYIKMIGMTWILLNSQCLRNQQLSYHKETYKIGYIYLIGLMLSKDWVIHNSKVSTKRIYPNSPIITNRWVLRVTSDGAFKT